MPTARASHRRRSRSQDGRGLEVRLEGGAAATAKARRALARLYGDVDQSTMETLRLLVTELVANSVRHARARAIGLKVAVRRARVLVEVTDPGPGFDPAKHDHRARDDAGWGLYLVDRLADSWGVNGRGDQTRVWFELRRT